VGSELLSSFIDAVDHGNDQALLLHQSFLEDDSPKNYELIKAAKRLKTGAIGKLAGHSQEEILIDKKKSDARHQSTSWSVTRPEVGQSQAGALVVDFPTTTRADEGRTTFRIGAANSEHLPEASVAAFTGVYHHITGEYGIGYHNLDSHPGKPAMNFTMRNSLGHGLGLASAADSNPMQIFPRQMVEGRRSEPIRTSVMWRVPLAEAHRMVTQNATFKEIFGQGYGMLTVYDPRQQAWFTYESEVDRYMLGKEGQGTWVPVQRQEVPDQEVQTADSTITSVPLEIFQ
jgi:hypothetical protein